METNSITNTQWSDEYIIDLIRKLRNDLIKDFLDERILLQYFASNFNVRDVSPIKVEFIKKALKELLIAPVDLTHYRPIIEQIKNTESAALSEGNEQLFYKELESVFKQHAY